MRIGVDIIEIIRIEEALDRFGNRFLERIFTTQEIEFYRSKVPSLAARFAGKEAVMKLLGTGIKGISWQEIEILKQSGGQPQVNLYGKARLKADSLGIKTINISLSHSKDYAIAFVAST
jgi:holo-[acyl-carrier protein] synthase